MRISKSNSVVGDVKRKLCWMKVNWKVSCSGRGRAVRLMESLGELFIVSWRLASIRPDRCKTRGKRGAQQIKSWIMGSVF